MMAAEIILTGEDLRSARTRLGLTQAGLAERLRLGARGAQTVSDWERRLRDVPGPVAVAVELMLAAAS